MQSDLSWVCACPPELLNSHIACVHHAYAHIMLPITLNAMPTHKIADSFKFGGYGLVMYYSLFRLLMNFYISIKCSYAKKEGIYWLPQRICHTYTSEEWKLGLNVAMYM